jgi:replicative DNA helicase
VRRAERRRAGGERTIGAERELVRVLLHRPAYLEQVIERLGAESFRDPEMRGIFAAMMAHGADAGFDVLAASLDGDAVVAMQELLEETGGLEHTDEAVAGSLAAMHERDLVRRMEEIDTLMPLAATDEKDVLTREKMQLRDELASLGGRHWKQFK